jgi:hypothetical protein
MSDPADQHRAPISETTLARDISGPLWGLVFLAAMTAWRNLSPDTFFESYTKFVLSSRPNLDGIIAAARRVGRFSTLLQEIFEEGLSNWGAENVRDADGISAWLCLYSSLLEELPIDLANSALVQRLVAFGLQSELVDLLAALIRAAWAREADPSAASVDIVEAVRRTLQLVPGSDANDRLQLRDALAEPDVSFIVTPVEAEAHFVRDLDGVVNDAREVEGRRAWMRRELG